MHRTTIGLDDAVYRRVKQLAQQQGRSVTKTIEELLKSSLGERTAAPVVTMPMHRANGPRPGVDIADRDRLYEILEQP